MEPFLMTAHAAQMAKERSIRREWIQSVLDNPMATFPDARDKSLTHKVRRIPENGGRALKVVIDCTRFPPWVITLFFDRKASRELP